jgi:hypothetical protein
MFDIYGVYSTSLVRTCQAFYHFFFIFLPFSENNYIIRRMDIDSIKHLIKQRGYTYQKVAKLLGYSIPTFNKLMIRKPSVIYYAVKGLPEVSHLNGERKSVIKM